MFRTIAAGYFFLLVLGSTTQSSHAQIWDEAINGGGDALSLPTGQITAGIGPLITINGTLANPDADADADADPDMYCIRITDPANFSATAVGSTAVDLSLWRR